MTSTAEEVGDEPKQIKQKYPEVRFVVDGNRRRAMRYLLTLPEGERPDVVLLDDGFQHRYVHPSFSILSSMLSVSCMMMSFSRSEGYVSLLRHAIVLTASS